MHLPNLPRSGFAVLMLALLVCASGCPLVLGGPFRWARTDGGEGPDAITGVVTRFGGITYVCGTFTGRAVFGAGEANETTLIAAGGAFDRDLFIARYANTGALDWAVSAGGPEDDAAAGIAALSDGSIAVTGHFTGRAVFGAGEPNERRLVAAGDFDQDAFVARYTAGGALIWARSEGGLGLNDAGTAISAFPDGSFVVAGTFEDRAVFETANDGPVALNAGGPFDTNIFLARYGRDGDLMWVSGAGGPAPDVAPGLTTVPGGGIVMTGTFEDFAFFGMPHRQTPIEIRAPLTLERDVFIARYNNDGLVVWVRRATGIDLDDGLAAAAFLDGSAVVVGTFTDTIVFAPDMANETTLVAQNKFDRDVFIAKYDRNGNLEWARQGTGIDDDYATTVSSTPGGRFFVAGTFTTAITLGPGEANETTLLTDREYDRNIFAAWYDADGLLDRAMRIPAVSAAFGAGVLPSGNVMVGGWIAEPMSFLDSNGLTISIAPEGSKDAFLARLAF